MSQDFHAKVRNLKERLIQTALESEEFKELLTNTITNIKHCAESARNEATVEARFELGKFHYRVRNWA